ncbi:MAG TPA: DUF2325 domain-containing protein [Polyangiales bacterium]|jgi:hypothetical protein|nr:DUF2325 domain-containing protein [Polyangiales bacterium]
MRVGIIGGVERNQARYEEVAKAVGCDVEFHAGHMRGRGTETLDTLIERCDLIVIVTEINSHTAVRMAQKFSRKRGRRVLIARKFGIHTFEQTARQALAEAAAQGGDERPTQPRVSTTNRALQYAS